MITLPFIKSCILICRLYLLYTYLCLYTWLHCMSLHLTMPLLHMIISLHLIMSSMFMESFCVKKTSIFVMLSVILIAVVTFVDKWQYTLYNQHGFKTCFWELQFMLYLTSIVQRKCSSWKSWFLAQYKRLCLLIVLHLKTVCEVNTKKSWIGSSWIKLIENILYNKKLEKIVNKVISWIKIHFSEVTPSNSRKISIPGSVTSMLEQSRWFHNKMTTDSDSECSYVANLADFNVIRVLIIVIVINIVYNRNSNN